VAHNKRIQMNKARGL